MRRPRALALVWAIGCVLAFSGVAAIPTAVPVRQSVADQPASVPPEFVWLVTNRCVGEVEGNFSGIDFALGEPGEAPRIVLWEMREDGSSVPLPGGDSRTRQVRACMDEFSYDRTTLVTRVPYEAEWRYVSEWVTGFARPCSTARGLEVGELEFPSEGPVPALASGYYALIRSYLNSELPVRDLLEIRRACPPMPPFLATQGIAW